MFTYGQFKSAYGCTSLRSPRSVTCEIELGDAEDAAQVLFWFELLLDIGLSPLWRWHDLN